MSFSRAYILYHQVLFLTTGLCTTLGTQWLFYTGAASGWSLFPQLSGYLGNILVGLLIPIMAKQRYAKTNDALEKGSPVEGVIQHRAIAKLAALDILANFCVTLGFSMVGSGMYQVIYSSVVIWCAILSSMFMGEVMSRWQWVAICGTSVGLAICATDSASVSSHSAPMSMYGTLVTLGGTFLYGCIYVYADWMLSRHKPAPLPVRVCFWNGCYTTTFALSWIGLYTMPRFDQLIHVQPSAVRSVWGMYAFVTLASATHAWSYYELLDRTGNVATGILQALRAILVYGLSHKLYCATDGAQCFTVNKACGSILVVGCVLVFNSLHRNHSKP